MEKEIVFTITPAFLPKENPVPSSQAKIPLDYAICTEGLHVLLFPYNGKINGELYSGIDVLNPSLIKGVRRGIEIFDKSLLFNSKTNHLSHTINELSSSYCDLKKVAFTEIDLKDEEVLDKFLLQKPGARIILSPSATYNHLSAPLDLNEIWVGLDFESYSYASRGNISPNIEDALNRESRMLYL